MVLIKTSSGMRFNTAACMALLTMQALFLFVPPGFVQLHNMLLRPAVYAVLVASIAVYIGPGLRPVRKASDYNMLAIASVIMLGIAFLAVSFLFGV